MQRQGAPARANWRGTPAAARDRLLRLPAERLRRARTSASPTAPTGTDPPHHDDDARRRRWAAAGSEACAIRRRTPSDACWRRRRLDGDDVRWRAVRRAGPYLDDRANWREPPHHYDDARRRRWQRRGVQPVPFGAWTPSNACWLRRLHAMRYSTTTRWAGILQLRALSGGGTR